MSVIIDGTSGITSPTLDLTSGQLSVADGGTGVSTSTGSGSNVLSTSPTLLSPLIAGATSGAITLASPSVAGTNTITLPAQTGTVETLGVGTSVASTSGTSITFTGIPAWAKRITVMFSGVSTSGTSNWLIQIGSGSLVTTGYVGAGSVVGAATCISSSFTTGFGIKNASASTILSGAYALTLFTGTTWVINGNLGEAVSPATYTTGGGIALGGALDRVVITTVNGTDTFDAGSINITWEG